jgi:diguanylate cyclase (GGDEF)-like protein
MARPRLNAQSAAGLCLAVVLLFGILLTGVVWLLHDLPSGSPPDAARLGLGLLILLGAGALGFFLLQNRLLIQPMQALATALVDTRHDTASPDGQLVTPLPIAELETIRRVVLDYRLQLRELHGALRNQNRTLHDQARRDALTGCRNRRVYDEDWSAHCALRASVPGQTSYLLFDCDRFRTINDSYGHGVADRVLALVADALTLALRAGDSLYRLGSDEFVAFLPSVSVTQARRIAQRCQELVEATDFERLGIREPVTISIGIANCDANRSHEVGELPRRADIAMFAAKQPGHRRVAVYGSEADASSAGLVASRETAALFQALAEPGHIEMHYQPLFHLPDRRLDGYEALARICHQGDVLGPGTFMPVVASRRLETEFDTAVLGQITRDLDAGKIPYGLGVSINLSAQSLARAETVGQLLAMARHLGRNPLTLEITETSLITQISDVRRDLDRLREVGYRVAMDDFGTGYSPVHYLLDLPVDSVKFDISLIRKLADGGRAGEIVAGLARLMSEAGYPLVAEGIETDADLLRAEALGFTHAQGFLLGRPAVMRALPHSAAVIALPRLARAG